MQLLMRECDELQTPGAARQGLLQPHEFATVYPPFQNNRRISGLWTAEGTHGNRRR